MVKAEAEVRVAQAEFDRQVEVTRLLLEGISSTHVCHLIAILTLLVFCLMTCTLMANALDICLTVLASVS